MVMHGGDKEWFAAGYRFTGTTAQGQPLDVTINVTLPAQTLRTRFKW